MSQLTTKKRLDERLKMKDPIDNIKWQDARELKANHWNPNVVFTPELKLLERSIMKTGWVQPILVTPEGTVIDGFHRWTLSKTSDDIISRYKYQVPTAILDISEGEAMCLTVRINRAKGDHTATLMSDLVRELTEVHGMDMQQIAVNIGATVQEVELLHQADLFKERNLKDYKYNKAWYPKESRNEKGSQNDDE